MALTAFESMMLTIAILGSVHLLVTLLQNMQNEDNDCREMMKDIAKYQFFQDPNFVISKKKSSYYH